MIVDSNTFLRQGQVVFTVPKFGPDLSLKPFVVDLNTSLLKYVPVNYTLNTSALKVKLYSSFARQYILATSRWNSETENYSTILKMKIS